MVQRSRLFRRQQHGRAIKRAKRFLKIIGLDASERQVHLYARNRKPCSCYICSGNKRQTHKWERRETKQQLRKDFKTEDIICTRKHDW